MTTQKTFFEAKLDIVQKAWKDPKYKKSLKADPKKALTEALGESVTENVVLHENTDKLTYVCLPTKKRLSQLKPTVPGGKKTLQSVSIALIKKVHAHPELKKQYIEHPKEMLEKELGTKLAQGKEFKVLEDSDTLINIILPLNPNHGRSQALSDSELDNIAGGAGLWGLQSALFNSTVGQIPGIGGALQSGGNVVFGTADALSDTALSFL